MITFGEYVRKQRIERGITLRGFCKQTGWDPSNWSKIERGKSNPPKGLPVLREVAKVLGIGENTGEWDTLWSLAAAGHVPEEMLDDKAVLEKLPIFFRTVRGEKPTPEELEKLIEIVREN